MPRNNSMPSSQTGRPRWGSGPKGASADGPRSPPRTSRTSPSSPRKGGGGSSNSTNNNTNANTVNSTFIAPPPRAALSGTSSPSPDHPRNNTNTNNNTTTTNQPTTRRGPSRPPSPLPPHASATHPHPATPPAATPTAVATASATATALATTHSQATAQAHAAALRARDARIAALEREQALMEAEFARELDKHAAAAAEGRAAAFWQGKCAALERALAEAEEAVGLLRGGGGSSVMAGGRVMVGEKGQDGRVVDNESWEGGDKAGDGDGRWQGYGGRRPGREMMAGEEEEEEDEEEDGEDEREVEVRELRTAWERAREALARRDDEVARLRAQVRGLKEWVSVSTRADGQAQTSDEVFGEGMARLGNGLQNWVLVNFRRARVDLSSADEDAVSELARLVPMYEELASRSKIHLLQSVVSRLLVELVFDAYFAGLPCDMAGQLKQVESMLASFASSPESINQWRSLTLTILKKDAHEKLQTESSSVIDTVVGRVNKLLDAVTNTTATDARDQGLQALVASAIELSRLLAVQKAVFRVEMPVLLPHQRTVFDAETMEDIGGEDEDSLADREICCVAFPGIVKRGDESGGHLQYRNVIAKAKVLCSPE